MAPHALLGASSAHRWMACPGSVALCDSLPDGGEESPYASEGTQAHDLAEQCLRHNMDAVDLPHDGGWGAYPQEMREYVQQYIDQVRAIHSEVGGELLIEQRVDYSEWVPGGFGTADAIIIGDSEIVAVDLKYGLGVRVDAPGNPQARLYLLGAYAAHELGHAFTQATGIIIQPRLDHYSSETLDLASLLDFAWEARRCAGLALRDDAPLVPGASQCRFCDAKAVCRARADENLATAKQEFNDDAPPPPPDKMALEEIAELLPRMAELRAWSKDVEEYALQQAVNGAKVPQHKVVEGRSVRRWLPSATEALKAHEKSDLLMTTKPAGIGQAERVLGKRSELIAAHTEKGRGTPTLVPESDKRPEVGGIEAAKADFTE